MNVILFYCNSMKCLQLRKKKKEKEKKTEKFYIKCLNNIK